MRIVIIASLCVFGSRFLAAQEAIEIDLRSAIDRVEHNSYSLQAAYQQIPFSLAQRMEGLSPASPGLGVDYEEVPNRQGLGKFGQRTFSIEQSFDFPLRYVFKYDALTSRVNAARAGYQSEVTGIKADTRNRYFLWLGSIEKMKITKESLKIAQDFYDKTQQLRSAGQVGRLALSRAKINLTEADIEFDKASNDEIIKRNELIQILALPSKTILKATDSIQYWVQSEVVVLPVIFDSSQSTMFRLSQARLGELKAALVFERTGYLPDISLRYFKQSFNGNNKYYGAGIGLSFPLWFFNRHGTVMQAKAAYQTSRIQFEQTKLNLVTTYQSLYEAFTKYKNKMSQYQSITVDAQSVFKDASLGYAAGEISYFEFLDAQRSYLQAKNTLLEIRLLYLTTLTELYKITGGV